MTRLHREMCAVVVVSAATLTGATSLTFAGPEPQTPQPRAGEPILGLTPQQLADFNQGKFEYDLILLDTEGLGPIFNQQSCASCHTTPLGGGGSQTVTRFGRSDKGVWDPLDGSGSMPDLGGELLQAEALEPACAEVIPPEANRVATRVTLGSMGYGLIEAIADADIIANETTPPSVSVSGRARMVDLPTVGGPQRPGRFGWKSPFATILGFTADAAVNEMGLTNRFFTEDPDPNGISEPTIGDCDMLPLDPESPQDKVTGLYFSDRVTFFQRYMTAPPQTPQSGMKGELIFNNIGCADCHIRDWTTPDDPLLEEALRNQSFRPYSDFLLHDMGVAGDGIGPAVPGPGEAGENEMRTPVLWGVRFRDPMWHDGRFGAGTFESRVTAAIMEHGAAGSEGATAAANFAALVQDDKDAVIAFLDSLGRAEFDADGDGAVGISDFLDFMACQGSLVFADDPCAVHDIDQDATVGAIDFESLLIAYTDPLEDCNFNGIADIEDIFDTTSLDVDNDGIPDECQCEGDFDVDGLVGFSDLTNLLAGWGPCTDCAADLDGNNMISFDDLTALLALWGPCD